MKLLDNPASPYCRKVKILLHELGMSDAVELVQTGGHPTAPNAAALAHNPIGKIPTLIRDDGPALYDSRVICRFINDHASGSFYPEGTIWETLTLEATAEGALDAAVLMVYENRSRAEGTQDPAWLEGQWAKIDAAITVLEQRWMAHLAGPIDMGVVAVGCLLDYVDFRHPDRDWRAAHPALADWFEKFGKRDSMRATIPRNP
ncbi:MAG: glutathione S-transferase [Rhodobacteraceae bacterium]|nr:glutathione S-transferase [Paracoccaceae bacterium]